MEQKILYFEKPGKQNQKKLLEHAKRRAKELDIKDVVVATSHGGTAIALKQVFDDPELNLIAVSIAEGFKMKNWCLTTEERERLEKEGIKVLTASHSLGGGVGSAFAMKYGGKGVEIELGATPEDLMARFWVRDTGPGVPPEKVSCLFRESVRFHEKVAMGYGLGLILVQVLAEQMNGKVGVESELGKGTKVRTGDV